jgi:hypothetical protein
MGRDVNALVEYRAKKDNNIMMTPVVGNRSIFILFVCVVVGGVVGTLHRHGSKSRKTAVSPINTSTCRDQTRFRVEIYRCPEMIKEYSMVAGSRGDENHCKDSEGQMRRPKHQLTQSSNSFFPFGGPPPGSLPVTSVTKKHDWMD